MPFPTLSNVDVLFAERELTWRSYTSVEVLSTTKRVQMIGRKKFAAATLDPGKEVFVVHVAYLGAKMSIHPTCEA